MHWWLFIIILYSQILSSFFQLLYMICTFQLFINESSKLFKKNANAMYGLFVIMAQLKSWNLNLPDNMATPLIQPVFVYPLVTVLMGFYCIKCFNMTILVSQNNETAAMLVSQTNHVGVELFCYTNAFFCSNKFA